MKKRLLFALLALTLAFSLISCSDNTDKEKVDLSDPTLSITECIEVPYQYDLTKYIDIAPEDYIGIEIEKVDATVTTEDLNNAIYEDLSAKATLVDVVDRPVAEGDTLDINFKGYMDGVAFDGGSAENQPLVIGSGSFIPGFEEALIGHNVGEEFTIDVTFPESYPNNPDMEGKPAQFEIKINSIKTSVLPELTVDFVKENFGVDTIEAYMAKLQEELVETKAAEAETARINNAFQKIYENVEFKEMPEKELEAFKNEFVTYYEDMAKYYNMTLTELISQLGSNEDEFYYYADVAAKASLEQDLIIFSIANAQGIWKDMKKADYDEYIAKQAELYDTDVKTIEEQDGAETIWKYLISDKTMEYVLANAVEVEPAAEEDTAETTETTETVDEK